MCEIQEYPHGTDYPKNFPDCRAEFKEGIPTSYVGYKLEETDMGYEHYDEYLDHVDYEVNDFMRNAVTDRNIDQPFADVDVPNYHATNNSGSLNLRYNETRGKTDYMPAHPELFIGDLKGSQEYLDIKMAKLKEHTAARADLAQVRMGNDNDFQLWESPWSDPDRSYAMKDMQTWVGNNLDWWQWPSFINPTYSSTQNSKNDPEYRKRRLEAADRDYDTVNVDPGLQDEENLIKKTIVGKDYYMAKYQDKAIIFADGTTAPFRSNPKPQDAYQNIKAVKEGNVNLFDQTTDTKIFKTKLAEAMKSSVNSHEQTQQMQNSLDGRTNRGLHKHDKKSKVKEVLKGHKENNEIVAQPSRGIHPGTDVTRTTKRTDTSLPYHLDTNKISMIKASRGEMDPGKAVRNITKSLELSDQVHNRMKAGACLHNYTDRGAIIRDIAYQHTTGCQTINKCKSGTTQGPNASALALADTSQALVDQEETKIMGGIPINPQPPARSLASDFDDKTFTDLANRDTWNSRH